MELDDAENRVLFTGTPEQRFGLREDHVYIHHGVPSEDEDYGSRNLGVANGGCGILVLTVTFPYVALVERAND
jgi:hypothetical protein